MASMEFAAKGIPTGKCTCAAGRGSDSKGALAILETTVSGEKNCCALDPNVSGEEPGEFREGGYVAWNKTRVGIRESKVRKDFEGDIWRRRKGAEEIDCRANFGQKAKLEFGESHRAQERNYAGISVIEEQISGAAKGVNDVCIRLY